MKIAVRVIEPAVISSPSLDAKIWRLLQSVGVSRADAHGSAERLHDFRQSLDVIEVVVRDEYDP